MVNCGKPQVNRNVVAGKCAVGAVKANSQKLTAKIRVYLWEKSLVVNGLSLNLKLIN